MYVILQLQHSVGDVSNSTSSTVQSLTELVVFFYVCFWVFFETLSREFEFHYNLTRITVTLHEDQYTFMIISLSFHLRMRNVSDTDFRETQNIHFMFSRVFPKILPFMR